MPYLIGPNCEPITPNANSATNKSGTECMTKPMMAMIETPISASFSRCAITALS